MITHEQKLVFFDTETTGLDPKQGDKIVEIAMVEMLERKLTGRELHFYFNPERDMPDEAFKVHGLSQDFLEQYPIFAKKAAEIAEFIAGATLVAHNARFDMKFLRHEFQGLKLIDNFKSIPSIDTIAMAKEKLPYLSRYSLDALCKHFSIDLSQRDKHGALVDTHLLVALYLQLTSGQKKIFGDEEAQNDLSESKQFSQVKLTTRPLILRASQEEKMAHTNYFKKEEINENQ